MDIRKCIICDTYERKYGEYYCENCLLRRFYVEESAIVDEFDHHIPKPEKNITHVKNLGKGPYTHNEIIHALIKGEISEDTLMYSIPDFLGHEMDYLTNTELIRKIYSYQLDESLGRSRTPQEDYEYNFYMSNNFDNRSDEYRIGLFRTLIELGLDSIGNFTYPEPWKKMKDLVDMKKDDFHFDLRLIRSLYGKLGNRFKKLSFMKGMYDEGSPVRFLNPDLSQDILSRLPTHYNKLTKKRKEIEPVIPIDDNPSKRQSIEQDNEQGNICSGSMCNIMGGNKKKLKRKSKRKSKKKSKRKSKKK